MWKKTEKWTNEAVLKAMIEGGSNLDRAFKGFYSLFRPMAASIVFKQFGLSDNDFDDVMSEVFMGLVRRLRTNQTFENATFSTYVYACIKNHCLMLKAKSLEKVTSSLETLPEHPAADDNPEMLLYVQEVMQKVNAMGEPCKTILIMRGKGYGHEEIAQKLNKALQTIKQSTVECRKTLINLLGGKKLY